ncbi:MAG TPA: PEP/pyruvate-binding domain-containing protein, partial [Spirochaetota bacterium]|nr:PEP/pyruvate-binding domain-containing protein [Spirochaetota bacterium]
MSNIIYFNKDLKDVNEKVLVKTGIRGRRAIELATMGLPIVPGFIIDADLTMKLPQVNIKEKISSYIEQLEKETKKKFGDSKKPMMLKLVLSSELNVPFFPSIHNIGMSNDTVEAFGEYTGKDFAYGEYLFLMRNIARKLYDFNDEKVKGIESVLSKKPTIDQIKKTIELYKKEFGADYSDDPFDQLVFIMKKSAERYCESDIDVDNSLSIMIQVMVYGNLGENSYAGSYFTRNIVTGDSDIQGDFLKNEFDFSGGKANDIKKIDKKYYDKFSQIARKIEENFKEIRNIKFTIEEGDFWLVEQREVDEKSTQAQIKTLLDLNKSKVITDEFLIKTIKPGQLNELLHPVIDPRTIKNTKTIKGGIAGSTGAAIGRVFFSTPKLLEEYKKAIMKGGDTNLILVLTSSFAEDVKAIEVAQGVVTCEGGFSSHAPVVARSLGKVAMVQPEMKIKGNTFTLGGKSVKEGDYISINVPYYEEPTIYLDKVGLIEPDFKNNGLLDFLAIVEKHIGNFNVRANADQERDALVAKEFKAEGIGL